MKIDAHQHYWHPARGDYHWMPQDDPVLCRPYGPADLAPMLARHGIGGTIAVQAAATVAETEYLLGLADATDSIRGVVGWIDFEDPGALAHLSRLAAHPEFLGVRPMIQDIPDVDWMLRDDVQWAYPALIELDLSFDALGFPQHLQNFLTLARRYPDLRIVLDHCMKPQISDQRAGKDAFGAWADGMSRLADETSACVKLSGLVTEAGDGWGTQDLRPFADHVLRAFGPGRVMWGSDWPVCQLQAGYDLWHDTAQALVAHLPAPDRAEIFGGTAARFYRLTP
ncbi:amidohydrolase family protein [Aestuariicoccus sp. MJ-SS9]|uniref:amidohydrolase family protein n=1 Tax=Aestuariicoccus sp. MJ-SS9 TaxID=3079855 RepID=UPI00290E160A|nr:amidohydrolase family protein [Aestuariicoccus sp. MJ-SS9]MDU8912447.1 amidohydrolase family protein [Aestuariicoccus sp. MJ-SS9]